MSLPISVDRAAGPLVLADDGAAPPAASSAGWLAVAAMLADLAFETDCAGRFTAFGPGKALGHPTFRLLGTEVAGLLAPAQPGEGECFTKIFATICQDCVGWQGHVRLTRADGSAARYRLTLAPRLLSGMILGAYGLLFELETSPPTPPEDSIPTPPRLDPETSLWTAPIFCDELARRFDRLDVEEHPGTLIYLGFTAAAADLIGPVAMRIDGELRDVVRPTDLLGRVDAKIIALWCDGMDHLTGAERAARFCTQLPVLLPGQARLNAGLATRWPGSMDDPRTVMARCAATLRLADQDAAAAGNNNTGPGIWRVWQAD
jgi:hypothetical protein